MFRLLALSLCFLLTGCDKPKEETSGKFRVVATFSILADLVREVGGDLIEVSTIVPENADPHVYQPTPRDAKLIAHAQLVFVNGLGFEGWFDRLISTSGYKGDIIISSKGVQPRTLINARGSPAEDPHAWHSVANAQIYVHNIADTLIHQFPKHEAEIRKREANYTKKLKELDLWVHEQFRPIDPDRRYVVTTHDAFWYYGEFYNLHFISPVGISTEAEPSAAVVAEIIAEIRDKNIRAIFIESLASRKLVEEIAKEAGVKVDGVLYADSLSDPKITPSPAKNYIEMIRHNTLEILHGLKS